MHNDSLCITAVERIPRRKRYTVELDGAPALTVTPEIAVQFGLRAGATLTAARFTELRAAQDHGDVLAAALRLISYRPRSEKELRDRLNQRNQDAGVVDATIARLKELRLIDDAEFAASWVQNRGVSSPRSRRLLASELRARGVQREIASASAGTVDEAEAAYSAGSRKARLLAGRPFDEFQRKVGDLLLRRGFSYETARETVRLFWRDLGDGAPTPTDIP